MTENPKIQNNQDNKEYHGYNSYNSYREYGDNEEEYDFAGLMLDYLAHWKWFVLSVFLCLALGWLVMHRMTPTYNVTASIYLNSDNSVSSASLFQDQASMLNFKDYIDEAELKILKSRNLLLQVVDSLDMAYAYYSVGRFRDFVLEEGHQPLVAKMDTAALHKLTAPIVIIATQNNGQYHFEVSTMVEQGDKRKEEKSTMTASKLPVTLKTPQGAVTLTRGTVTGDILGTNKIVIKNPSDVALALSRTINIDFASKSTMVVNISYPTDNPSQGVECISAMINAYNKDINIEKTRSAMQTEDFIIQRLALVESELNDAEHDVESYRRANNITDISAETQIELQRSQESDKKLADIEVEQRIVGEVERMVSNSDNYQPLPQVINDASLNAVITSYNAKVAQRAALLQGGTNDNPLVKSINEELAHGKKEIYQGVQNIKRALTVRRNDMASQEGSANSRLSSMPVNERELFSRIRKQNVKENIYNYLLEKREELSIQKTLATPTARLIDNPTAGGPVSPRFMMGYLLALVLGLAIPALVIFLYRYFFPILKDRSDLEKATNVSILGEISVGPAHEKFVVAEGTTTPTAELFRLLRNNIKFLMTDPSKKVILVTSTVSGEGKTYVASNLAMTFALTGKKTLVIGMDIRRPFLAHTFDRTNDVGVTSYLSGQVDDIMSTITVSDQLENLYVLSAGPVPPNPNELLMSERMKTMMDVLRENFDIIVIDSAPVGMVSDTLLFTKYTDIQIYVTRSGKSTRKYLTVLHNAISAGQLDNCYLVMNGVQMTTRAYGYRHYGTYEKHSYGYRYGEKKRSIFSRIFKRK